MSHVLITRRYAGLAELHCECGYPIGVVDLQCPVTETARQRWRQELVERHRMHVRNAVNLPKKWRFGFNLEHESEVRALAVIMDALRDRAHVVAT